MLDRLQDMGQLTHVRNDAGSLEGPQWSMLKAADKHSLTRAADWILVLDIDEFVNIHLGARRLPDLIAALPDADAITLTWRMFGNLGADGTSVIEMADTPVTRTFTHAAPVTLGWPWRAQMFKTLFKNNGHYRKLGVHRPRSPDAPAPRWFDGSGRELGPAFHTNRIFSDYTRDNYQMVQMNHYALGSVENYLVKADRGRSNRDSSGFDMGYWIERNLNSEQDSTIAALDSAALRAELMGDAILGPLHHAGFAWRRARFAALMADEPWRALFGRLLMTPPSNALPPEMARRITQFVV